MTINPLKRLKKRFNRDLLKDTSGNVAMIAGLAIVPIVGVLGFAVDLQVVVTKKNTVQQTLDATLIAVARQRQVGQSDTQLNMFADEYFNGLIQANDPSIQCPAPGQADVILQLDPDSPAVGGSVMCQQPTTLSALFGRERFDFEVSSGSTFGVNDIDIAFVFDLSGSMNCPEDLNVGFNNSCNGDNSDIRTRMDALKEGAQAAVDILLASNANNASSNVRIAMTGYTNAVNAGSFFSQVVEIPNASNRRPVSLENSEFLGDLYEDQILGNVQLDTSSERQFFDYEAINCPGGLINQNNCRGSYTDLAARFYYPLGGHPTCTWARQGPQAATDLPPGSGAYLRAARPVWDYLDNRSHNNDTQFTAKRNAQDEIQRQTGLYRHGVSGSSDRVIENVASSNEVFQGTGAIDTNSALCDLNLPPQPLTTDLQALTSFIDQMEPIGGTAGHAGTAWGWYMLSPKWSGIWPNASEPLPYNEPQTAKFLILMTDGEFNSAAPGAEDDSIDQAADLCRNIQEDTNITIYTVKLGAFPSQNAVGSQDITEFCASDSDFALNPVDGDSLVADFERIAVEISDLRIAQ